MKFKVIAMGNTSPPQDIIQGKVLTPKRQEAPDERRQELVFTKVVNFTHGEREEHPRFVQHGGNVSIRDEQNKLMMSHGLLTNINTDVSIAGQKIVDPEKIHEIKATYLKMLEELIKQVSKQIDKGTTAIEAVNLVITPKIAQIQEDIEKSKIISETAFKKLEPIAGKIIEKLIDIEYLKPIATDKKCDSSADIRSGLVSEKVVFSDESFKKTLYKDLKQVREDLEISEDEQSFEEVIYELLNRKKESINTRRRRVDDQTDIRDQLIEILVGQSGATQQLEKMLMQGDNMVLITNKLQPWQAKYMMVRQVMESSFDPILRDTAISSFSNEIYSTLVDKALIKDKHVNKLVFEDMELAEFQSILNTLISDKNITVDTGITQTVRNIFDFMKLNCGRKFGAIICSRLNTAETDHTAIMAKSLGIPVIGVTDEELTVLADANNIQLNMRTGAIINDISAEKLDQAGKGMRKRHLEEKRIQNIMKADPLTLDGKRFELMITVNDAAGAPGQKIGLFRSEMAFLIDLMATNGAAPSLSEQIHMFERALKNSFHTTIRTLDIFGTSDKHLGFIERLIDGPLMSIKDLEEYPKVDQIYFEHISAIIRAYVTVRKDMEFAEDEPATLKLMVPTVRVIEDMDYFNQLLQRVISQKEFTGDFNSEKELVTGFMIETLDALKAFESLLKTVQFVSLGTNDSSRDIFSESRYSTDRLMSPAEFNPIKLLIFQHLIHVAKHNGKRVGVCGEYAEKPLWSSLFVAMGADYVSVPAVSVPDVKESLLSSTNKKYEVFLDNKAGKYHKIGPVKELYKFINKQMTGTNEDNVNPPTTEVCIQFLEKVKHIFHDANATDEEKTMVREYESLAHLASFAVGKALQELED